MPEWRMRKIGVAAFMTGLGAVWYRLVVSGQLTLEVDGALRTFPLIKAAKGSAKAREKLKNLYPI